MSSTDLPNKSKGKGFAGVGSLVSDVSEDLKKAQLSARPPHQIVASQQTEQTEVSTSSRPGAPTPYQASQSYWTLESLSLVGAVSVLVIGAIVFLAGSERPSSHSSSIDRKSVV